MFNAPRPPRYSGNQANGLSGSFVEQNPLGPSGYEGLDPWSAAPTPSPPPPPSNPSVFSSVIADATVPAIYNRSYAMVDPTNSGETSVNALSRVLGTASLPASTVDRIVNLVSSRPRVSKLEFFVALALVSLAQSGKDVSIEQVAALSSQNTLPEPKLDLEALQPSTSAFGPSHDKQPAIRSPAPAYSSEDPWNTGTRFPAANSGGSLNNGAPSALSGTGLPKDWWKRQENVDVAILGQQGFILNRYTVYEIASGRGAPVPRRYSEFVFLWDCLVRRYPFRLFPALPPKRIGPDETFLEQRRRGLLRFINFVVNHPIIKEDGLLAVFLTEPSFEAWRKHSSISLEEESASKRVDRVEEMSIPSDLDEKLGIVRRKIIPLIEQWQRICILVERIIKRREAAAVRIPTALRHSYLPTHFAFPPFTLPILPFVPSSASTHTTTTTTTETDTNLNPASSVPLTSSMLSILVSNFNFGYFGGQADLSRLTNVVKALVEVNDSCWRGQGCELCEGVRVGLGHVAAHTQRHSDLVEQRTDELLSNTLEALKGQRDLYIAMRDLFIRHDRLSVDQVERLKKRVEANSLKLESIKAVKKEGWQEEAERIIVSIEKDQASITTQLHRRVFIRACMWHELRVVLHNRENALLSQTLQTFAREEQEFSEHVATNWVSLGESIDSMPFE